MKIDTMIDITVSNNFGYTVVNDSQTIKAFVSSESKIEDLVISQLQRFLMNKGIEDKTPRLEAYPTSYSSLEYSAKHNGFNYEVFVRVETEKEKITFDDYYPVTHKSKSLVFQDADALADELRKGKIFTNDLLLESAHFVFYDEALLNPFRVGNYEDGDIAINGTWDECDGSTVWTMVTAS